MKKISNAAERLIGQPMFHFLVMARGLEQKGQRIIHYEIGDPNFDSPDAAKRAIHQAIDGNLTHYTSSMGVAALRQAIAEHTARHIGFLPTLEQVLICPANAVIDFTIRCVANPQDEVIYPEPGFSTFHSAIYYNGMIPVGVPLKERNGFRLDPNDVVSRITKKTRLIIMNSPSNPTGAVMTKEQVAHIAQIAKEKDIYLLTDETYSQVIYEATHYSPAVLDQCRERTIILNSFSKTYSMAGWRLGYAVGPQELIAKMGLILETIISCLPAFTQMAGIAVLKEEDSIIGERVRILKERRDLLIEGLNRLPGVSCVLPEGAFYAFPNIKETGLNSNQYAEQLLHSVGVCVLPGNCFGPSGENFVRLSFASTSVEDIRESLDKMSQFHQKLKIKR